MAIPRPFFCQVARSLQSRPKQNREATVQLGFLGLMVPCQAAVADWIIDPRPAT